MLFDLPKLLRRIISIIIEHLFPYVIVFKRASSFIIIHIKWFLLYLLKSKVFFLIWCFYGLAIVFDCMRETSLIQLLVYLQFFSMDGATYNFFLVLNISCLSRINRKFSENWENPENLVKHFFRFIFHKNVCIIFFSNFFLYLLIYFHASICIFRFF